MQDYAKTDGLEYICPHCSVTNYSGNLQIHNANGNNLRITTSDISSSLTNVYVSPNLTNNLILVGQLVENDCRVEFSKSVCLVQH